MIAVVLLSALPVRTNDAASTQLPVMAKVLPTRQVAAANSTVNIILADGARRALQLSAEEKQALTTRAGYVPVWLPKGDGSRVPVVEINF